MSIEGVIGSGLDVIEQRLERQDLEPDPDRADWHVHQQTVRELVRSFERDVLEPFERRRHELEPETAEQVAAAVAIVGAEVAGLLYAARSTADASALVTRLAQFADGVTGDQLDAIGRDRDGFVRLVHGRWLMRRGDTKSAQRVLRGVARRGGESSFAAEARAVLDSPRPISGAPALFRINGCGLAMYGARDRRPDGTQVSTHCISAVWVPVMPLSAYRLVDHGDGSYGFIAKVPLSKFAIWYRRLVLAAVAVLIAWNVAAGYLRDPDRLASQAIDEAEAVERSGDRDAAIAQLEAVVDEYGGRADRDTIGRAGVALARLYTAQIEEPFGPDDVERAQRIARRFQQLPEVARSHAASNLVVDRLLGWSAALGDGVDELQLRLKLLDTAAAVAPGNGMEEVVRRRAKVTTELAAALAGDWPLAALDLYLDLSEPDALAAAGDVLLSLGDRHSLWRAARPRVLIWLRAVNDLAELSERARQVRDRLAEVEALETEERAAALESGDAERLAAHLAAHPGDQEAAVALADLELANGETDAAVERLVALGEPGWLIPDAQQLLASAYMQSGRLVEADALLTGILVHRMVRYERAAREYTEAADRLQQTWLDRAERGDIPPELERRLDGKSEEEQWRVFVEWVREKADANPKLAELRDTYLLYSDVVPMSLGLGTVKLRRASGAAGDERAALLGEAERAFLAIRQDAEGVPSYHLGLGQVYHRLGRVEEGERELNALLERGDSEIDLAVASAYRELGLMSRAKQVATGVYEKGVEPYAASAALMMSIVSDDLEEVELWLQRSDRSQPAVRIRLREVEAQRKYEAGDYAAADRLQAEVARHHEKDAKHDAAAGNNAAVAYIQRYLYSGERSHLARAKELYDTALRLEPDQAILVNNVADVYALLGYLGVLDEWIDPSILRISGSDAKLLVGVLLDGPFEQKVRDAVRTNPQLRRAFELKQQYVILAPGSATGYAYAAARYAELQDVERLRALHETLARRETGFDDAESEAVRERLRSGAADEGQLSAIDGNVEHLRAAQRMARLRKDSRTLAAARLLEAIQLSGRAHLTGDLAVAEKALAGALAAEQGWPALARARYSDWMRVQVATLAAVEASPAVEAAWRRDHRDHDVVTWLYVAATGEGGAEIAAALAAQPALRAAVESRNNNGTDPGITDWVLGQVTGDEALVRRGDEYLGTERYRLSAKIDALLDPTDPNAALRAELFERHAAR